MEKNKSEILDLAYWTQKQAKAAGAAETSLGISRSRSVEVHYRDGNVEKMKESIQQGLSIEVYARGRYSTHSTNDLRKASLEKFIQDAVDLTGYLEEDEFRGLADPELYKGRSDVDLDLVDPGFNKITTGFRKDRAAELGELIQGRDDRLISVASGFSDYHGESYRLKSNGFEGQRETTYYNQYAEVSLQGEGDRKPQGWRYYSARHLEDLPSLEQTAAEALKRTQDQVGQEKVDSATMPMLVENSNASGLFWRLMYPLSAAAIQQKSSFLAERQGQAVAAEQLGIMDDPIVVRGLGSRYFDGDGIAAKKLPIIENGVLRNYYVDVYYGRKLGWAPTTGGSSNLIVVPGTRSAAEMEAEMKRGILVTMWLGGNANSTTGDFSLGVSGWLIENGKRTLPISEMNIAGNYAELLMNLKEVGNDPYEYSSFRTPTLLFEGVTFSGT